MKKLALFAIALVWALPALGQAQHDHLNSLGYSVFDAFSNRTTILVSGATPDVSGGKVLKTNNGGSTSITDFPNVKDTQRISVNCGDTNTTVQNNSNIVTASGADFVCSSTNIGT